MCEIIYLESGGLINASLRDNIRVRLRVVDTLAHCHIMENTKRQRKRHVKVETRVSRLRDLRISDWILVDWIVLYGVLNVGVDIGLCKFPVGYQMWVIIWIVSVHSQLLILHLFKAMKFSEELELFHKACKWLRINVIISTKIDSVWEIGIWLDWFLVVITCLYDWTHIRSRHCKDLFILLSIAIQVGPEWNCNIIPIVCLYDTVDLIIYRFYDITCSISWAHFENKWDFVYLGHLLWVNIDSIEGIQEIVHGREDLWADPECHGKFFWNVY